MKKCLITGASGFLGRAVVERLSREFDVVRLSHRTEGPGLTRVDIQDPAALRGVVEKCGPDLVIHLAAYRDPDFCEEHPEKARKLNVEPVRTLREALPETTRLFFASTDYVFDGQTPPYSEVSPRHPISVYGATKCEAEDVLAGRPNTVILRFPVLVGAGGSLKDSGFVAQILDALQADRPAILDDVLMRCPIWIRDIADAIAFLEGRKAEGLLHLSGPRGATRYSWTVEIGRMLGKPTDHLQPSKIIVPRLAERPLNAQLETGKIRSLGFGPFTDFPRVVREVVATFP